MGSLCSACRKAQDETEEDQPLLHSTYDTGPGVEEEPETSEELSAKYYQRIIDELNAEDAAAKAAQEGSNREAGGADAKDKRRGSGSGE
mgnify:CR=1 FL=1